MSETERFDAVVIGSGVGGLCAAALLAHAGRRTLVVERLDRVGGRASTEWIDGFAICTGAVGLELGGDMEDVFRLVGAAYEIREPTPLLAVRTHGRTFNASGPLARFLIDSVILRLGARRTRRWAQTGTGPSPEETFADWLGRYTSSATIHRLMRNVAAALLSVNSHELSARAMLTYATQKGAFRRFGYVPGGTITAMAELAAVVERHGGEIWLSSEVERLTVGDGRVVGAVVRRSGQVIDVSTDVVVSNAGPRATVALCEPGVLPPGYVETVQREQRSAAMITFHLASREPLMGNAGLVFFADTERLGGLAYLSGCCPDVAPPGWHLYVAGAVPDPAVGDFDDEAEIAIAREELYREVPGARAAREIAVRVMRDDWPCQRAVIGRDLPRATPLPNLFNVGDAVREYPNAGTQGCAESARLVVREILAHDGARSDSYGAPAAAGPGVA